MRFHAGKLEQTEIVRNRLHILAFLTVLLLAPGLRGWSQEADQVKLISAKSAQLIEKNGQNYRKVVGPAKFFHNNTYLLCDTALWNVTTNIIDAAGHVRIIQNRTQLSSNTLQYVVDENMAKFRGALVQLEDKDKNTLRTRYLDYNTKDSVAIFQGGAAMRDKDGQVIESQYGTYDSKAHLFVFNDQVNMYMDTTFIKTSRLEYRSDLSTAYFGYATDMWQDDKMLSANDGWYDRGKELFFFRRNVHILTTDQEAWSDTLFYERALNNVEMLGQVELMDTTRNVFALAGRFQYTDSLAEVRMTREPAVMSVSEEKNRLDTLYLGADLLIYRTIKKCDISSGTVTAAEKRLNDISGDPVMEHRKKAAEAAAKAAEEAAAKDPNRPPVPPAGKGGAAPDKGAAAPDKPDAPGKGKGAPPREEPREEPEDVPDSLRAGADSLSRPKKPALDTTKITFLTGSKRVRMFRRDMQMSSDSLAYNDLDSLIRLYQNPIFYNEGDRQYTSDSIYLVIHNRTVDKAHLLSNAFITIQEDVHSYDQIRGAEMVAYFDSTSALTRFDALGGASTLFFLEENDALATVNKVDAKMIYATFKNGDIERMYYYDNPKNDGYPTVQLPNEEKELKGFRWDPELRPASPLDVTTLVPRESERYAYLARPHTKFLLTETYFPGHIKKIYRDIAIRDSLEVVKDRQRRQRERERQMREDSLARAAALEALRAAEADSLAIAADTLSVPVDSLLVPADSLLTASEPLLPPTDSLAPPPLPEPSVPAQADSLGTPPPPFPADSLGFPADSLGVPTDSLSTRADSLALPPPLTPEQQRALEKEQEKARIAAEKAAEKAARRKEQEAKRQAREAERKAKEAEQARKEAEEEAALQAKWAVQDSIYAAKQAVKDQKKLEKQRAKKLKMLRRLEKKAQRERKIFERYLKREQKKAARRKNRKRL